jgi:DNA-binding transcriptional ArsR family regulator
MLDRGLLTSRREGQTIYYRIADWDAIQACLFGTERLNK